MSPTQSPTPGHWYLSAGLWGRDHMVAKAAASAERRQADELVHTHRKGEACEPGCLRVMPDGTVSALMVPIIVQPGDGR